MNRKQKVAVVVGVVVIVLLALFPPWARRLAPLQHGGSVYCTPQFDYGRALLFDPPEDPPTLYMILPHDAPAIEPTDSRVGDLAIDWAAQFPWLLTTLALTVAAVLVLKDRKAGA